MKNISKALLVLLLTIGFISCKKSFLEKEPISALTTGNFYKTAADAEAGLAGAYTFGQSEFYIWDYIINGDVQSDNCYAGGNSGNVQNVDDLNLSPTNGQVERDWLYLYNCIATANAVISNVPDINDVALTAARKAEILGEAKFLRAMHYFHLAVTYGDVPLVVSTGGDLFPARNPASEVYAQIEADLNEAESVLPVTAVNAGRATKGAAQALLAKVYAQQLKYNDCLAACNRVLPGTYGGTGTGGYALVSSFENLWNVQNKNTSESIFEVQHQTNTPFSNWGIQLFTPNGDTWAKFCNPTNDLVSLFVSEGDLVRFRASVYTENTNTTGNGTPPPYTAATQPVPFAYKLRPTNGGPWNGDCNTILLRLADIILLKAEALNKTGQSADAIPLVNAIRARVNLTPVNPTGEPQVAAAILKERRLELAFEGHRWMDLLRTGPANTIAVMNTLARPDGTPLNYNASENKLLWPIPQIERTLGKNLSQNPGY